MAQEYPSLTPSSLCGWFGVFPILLYKNGQSIVYYLITKQTCSHSLFAYLGHDPLDGVWDNAICMQKVFIVSIKTNGKGTEVDKTHWQSPGKSKINFVMSYVETICWGNAYLLS